MWAFRYAKFVIIQNRAISVEVSFKLSGRESQGAAALESTPTSRTDWKSWGLRPIGPTERGGEKEAYRWKGPGGDWSDYCLTWHGINNIPPVVLLVQYCLASCSHAAINPWRTGFWTWSITSRFFQLCLKILCSIYWRFIEKILYLLGIGEKAKKIS